MIRSIRRRLSMDRESGSGTFIFNFMLFPVLLGFFGLAFDFSAAFWTKGALQQYLDAATQSALGQIDNPSGDETTPNLGTDRQAAANGIALRAEEQYALNRYGVPFLACQSGGDNNPTVPGGYVRVNPADGCTYSMSTRPNLRISGSGIYTFTMNVHEESRYMFLQIVPGFRYQGYNLRSTATLTTSYIQN